MTTINFHTYLGIRKAADSAGLSVRQALTVGAQAREDGFEIEEFSALSAPTIEVPAALPVLPRTKINYPADRWFKAFVEEKKAKNPTAQFHTEDVMHRLGWKEDRSTPTGSLNGARKKINSILASVCRPDIELAGIVCLDPAVWGRTHSGAAIQTSLYKIRSISLKS